MRTLVLASKKLEVAEYESWKKKYDQLLKNPLHSKKKKDEIESEIEVNMIIIGATAIEDKL